MWRNHDEAKLLNSCPRHISSRVNGSSCGQQAPLRSPSEPPPPAPFCRISLVRLAFPRTPALLPTEGALLNNRYPLANLRCISTAAATFPNRHTPSPPLCRVGRGCAPGAWPKLLPGRRRRSGLPAVLVPGFATERSVEIRGRMHRIPTRDDDHHRLQPIHVRLVMEVAPVVGIPTTRERQAHEGLALAAFRPVQAFPVTIKAACRFSNSVSSCDTPTCC